MPSVAVAVYAMMLIRARFRAAQRADACDDYARLSLHMPAADFEAAPLMKIIRLDDAVAI